MAPRPAPTQATDTADDRVDTLTSYTRYPASSANETLEAAAASVTSALSTASDSLTKYLRTAEPETVAIISAVGATGITLVSVAGYRRWFKRLRNADSITSSLLDRKPFITGVVTRVGDGDGFRLYHTPGLFWRPPLQLRRVPTSPKDLKDETLSIRIAGVDAPELAHFGNPAQPHGKESLDWLTATVLGKRVKCQLLRKDQYNRIVAVPYLPRLFLPNKPLPLMMLRDGQAVVYTQGGSEYGPWGLDKMQQVEDEAKRARRGLWSAKSVELPGDFKKRAREGDEGPAKKVKLGANAGWWERLGRWLGGKT